MVTSQLALAELLVLPFRRQNSAEETACRCLLAERPGLAVTPVSGEVLELAARLRAATSMRMPDAIHMATAKAMRCDMFLTNDKRIPASDGPQMVLLSDI